MFEALDCIPSKERRKKGAKKKGFQATIKLWSITKKKKKASGVAQVVEPA
jgi:hypothetical protein